MWRGQVSCAGSALKGSMEKGARMNQEYSRRKRREQLVRGWSLLSFCLLSVGFLYLSIFLDQKVLDYPNIVNTLDAVPFLILLVCVISVYNKVYDFANRRMYRQLYSVGVTLFLIQVFMVALPYFGYEFRISEEGDAALAAASGSDLLSVAGDVPEDLLHGGEALPGAADRRERGCGEHPAEVFVFQPQVPDREDPGRGGRRHGGSDKGIRRGDARATK